MTHPKCHIGRREFVARMSLLGLGSMAGVNFAGEPKADVSDLSCWIRPLGDEGIFSDPDWNIWCGSAIIGSDGRYHLYYSRWPRRLGHLAWVTHSEIARAVSDAPTGPYRHVEVVFPARGPRFWDGSCTHNPTITRIGGRYCLFYMGNVGDGIVREPLNWLHRNNQRIGVAFSDTAEGPWTRLDAPIINTDPDPSAPDSLVVTNPAVCARLGGGVLLIYKAVGRKAPLPFGGPVVHLVDTADRPEGPYTKMKTPIFTMPGIAFAAEDSFIWRDRDRFRAVLKDNNGLFTKRGYSIAQFESADGFSWGPCAQPFVTTPDVVWKTPGHPALHALERPQIVFDRNAVPVALLCAAAFPENRDHSFNLALPLVRPS